MPWSARLLPALTAVAAAALLAGPAHAATKNAVSQDVPTSATVNTPIPFGASLAWNIKDERGSKFLVWTMWWKRGTTKCPVERIPKKSADWTNEVAIRRPSEDSRSSSISTTIGPFTRAGRYRLCSYVATAHYRKDNTYSYDDVKAADSDVMKVAG